MILSFEKETKHYFWVSLFFIGLPVTFHVVVFLAITFSQFFLSFLDTVFLGLILFLIMDVLSALSVFIGFLLLVLFFLMALIDLLRKNGVWR